MKEFKLSSGAVLKVSPAPFADAKALYQAVLAEARTVGFTGKTELPVVLKDVFCISFSSRVIEACLWECFKRCQYNAGSGDLKIDKDTFEPLAARGDYVEVCMIVGEENIGPFVKSLYAEYKKLLDKNTESQA